MCLHLHFTSFCLLDDETHLTDTVDRQLKLLSETELNDDSVVDYLLDLSQEVKQKYTQKTNPQVPVLFQKHSIWHLNSSWEGFKIEMIQVKFFFFCHR